MSEADGNIANVCQDPVTDNSQSQITPEVQQQMPHANHIQTQQAMVHDPDTQSEPYILLDAPLSPEDSTADYEPEQTDTPTESAVAVHEDHVPPPVPEQETATDDTQDTPKLDIHRSPEQTAETVIAAMNPNANPSSQRPTNANVYSNIYDSQMDTTEERANNHSANVDCESGEQNQIAEKESNVNGDVPFSAETAIQAEIVDADPIANDNSASQHLQPKQSENATETSENGLDNSEAQGAITTFENEAGGEINMADEICAETAIAQIEQSIHHENVGINENGDTEEDDLDGLDDPNDIMQEINAVTGEITKSKLKNRAVILSDDSSDEHESEFDLLEGQDAEADETKEEEVEPVPEVELNSEEEEEKLDGMIKQLGRQIKLKPAIQVGKDGKKRKYYDREAKLAAIDLAKAFTNTIAAKKFKVDRKTIRDWIKNERQLRKAPTKAQKRRQQKQAKVGRIRLKDIPTVVGDPSSSSEETDADADAEGVDGENGPSTSKKKKKKNHPTTHKSYSNKRQVYTAQMKLAAVRFAKSQGIQKAALAFKVDSKSIRDWIHYEQELKTLPPESKRRVGGGNKIRSIELENDLVSWILNERFNNQKVTMTDLYERLCIMMMCLPEDKRSRPTLTWLARFMQRNNLLYKRFNRDGTKLRRKDREVVIAALDGDALDETIEDVHKNVPPNPALKILEKAAPAAKRQKKNDFIEQATTSSGIMGHLDGSILMVASSQHAQHKAQGPLQLPLQRPNTKHINNQNNNNNNNNNNNQPTSQPQLIHNNNNNTNTNYIPNNANAVNNVLTYPPRPNYPGNLQSINDDFAAIMNYYY